jgi:hypothetical protein
MEHISSWSSADDDNVLDESINTVKRIPESVLDASKEVVLEVSTKKPKYLGTAFTNQNCIHNET